MKTALIGPAALASLLALCGLPASASAAPSAPTAAQVTITVAYNYVTQTTGGTPSEATVAAGETFVVKNSLSEGNGSYVAVVNGTGSASVAGTSCESAVKCKLPDQFPNNPTMVVTATSAGTVRVVRVNTYEGTTERMATVTVSASPRKPAITIVGERGKVGGYSGVVVTGITTDLRAGAGVTPFIRFPGQTSYSEGAVKPSLDANGEFTWSRKTGKKMYVYFTSANGEVVSNRIIIQSS